MIARIESYCTCFVCGGRSGEGVEHVAQDFPTYSKMKRVYEEQCNALRMYKKRNSPYFATYNRGWRNHPNFSWKSNQLAQANNYWKPEPQAPRSYPAP